MGLSCYLKSFLEKEPFADFAFLNQKEKATQLRGFFRSVISQSIQMNLVRK